MGLDYDDLTDLEYYLATTTHYCNNIIRAAGTLS